MAQSGSQNIGFRLDINQILSEAQHRWLRPAEICEILRNYQKFHVTPEPPQLPISGSVFLFDRKVLRYFRKDGHIWRKKKDGKTVKEAHEKLKVGSVDMLHCYYAHGEQNENFQRRSYWMLEPDLMHIVFVHYLDVKGNKTHSTSLLDTESFSTSSHNDNSFSSSPAGDNVASTYTDMTSPTSTLTSAYEDAECVQLNGESNHHAYSRYNSYLEAPQGEVFRGADNVGAVRPNSYNLLQSFAEYIPTDPALGNGQCGDGCFVPGSQGTLDLESWGDVLGSLAAGESAGIHGSWNLPEPLANVKGQINHNAISSAAYDSRGNLVEHKFLPTNLQKSVDQLCIGPDSIEEDNVNRNHKKQLPSSQVEYVTTDKTEKDLSMMGNGNCPLVLKQSHLSGLQLEDGLKKVDSFSRWMTKELGEVNDLQLQPNNAYSWNEIETDDVDGNSCMPGQLQLDSDTLNFSLSQDQLFSISDFSPNWAYCNSGTEVLITGRFLKSGQVVQCKWSCMFGEVEVPAKVLADGVLCCLAPPHKAGLVPFYITCSNRVACSEVREFEYRPRREDINEMRARKRLDMLISRRPIAATGSPENIGEKRDLVTKIMSLMEEDNNMSMKFLSGDNAFVCGSLEEQQGQECWKDNFFTWLLQIVTEEGKGPTVLDEEGQGVLHLAAALGFNWALKPITASGVSIDFRDINGWTALHWAAFCGREDTVAALVSLGAASGALTDPCAEYPLGRTPADLASANGYKGISGFLAECSLTSHLKLLNVEDSADDNVFDGSGAKAVQTISERLAAPPTSEEDVPDTLTLKDSLAAVRNATQAAARIHQIFRIHSFQRKMLNTQGGDEPSSSDECALSLLATRKCRLGQHDSSTHTAAVQIQKKFRGWKKRKEFLIIRERIVKIQAHVRGHQARKKYKPIIWSVGILEKVILRWRRKGSGLRGFQGPSTQETPVKEGDDDFLKEGRKQSEERMHKALNRVKSMVQYPEARAQYRRLLNVAEGLRETEENKSCSAVPSPSEPECSQYPDEYLIDVEHLFDDDAFMAMAMD